MQSSEDQVLRRLGLETNDELEEGKELGCEDEFVLKRVRVPGLELNEVWEKRIFRSWKANGRDEMALAESYERIGRYRRKERPSEEAFRLLGSGIRSCVGGRDLYGHLIWLEQIVDLEMLVEAKNRLAARAALCEAVDQLKDRQRYRHVYILDLNMVSPFLLRRKDVRNALQELISFGSKYYPDAPATKAKIRICSHVFLDEMAGAGIPAAAVPTAIGGGHPGIDLIHFLPAPLVHKTSFSERGTVSAHVEHKPLPPRQRPASLLSNCFSPSSSGLFSHCLGHHHKEKAASSHLHPQTRPPARKISLSATTKSKPPPPSFSFSERATLHDELLSSSSSSHRDDDDYAASKFSSYSSISRHYDQQSSPLPSHIR